MHRVLTRYAVSEKSAVDTNRDGVFDEFLLPSARYPSISVGFFEDGNERRCAVVFDLKGMGGVPTAPFPIVSVHLSLRFMGSQGGGSYEVHGFSSGPDVALSDLTTSNRLFGPFPQQLPFPIDVTAFVTSHLAADARYVGFSVWNVATVGHISFRKGIDESILTITREIPWELPRSDVPGLVVEIRRPEPWALPRSDVPGLVVEIRPPEPWALPLSDVPRLVAEMLFGVTHRRGEDSSASPMRQILNAVLMSELAASMPEAGARAMQRQALEMISRIAADEIARLGREQP
jgi:hypothetical protein